MTPDELEKLLADVAPHGRDVAVARLLEIESALAGVPPCSGEPVPVPPATWELQGMARFQHAMLDVVPALLQLWRAAKDHFDGFEVTEGCDICEALRELENHR